MPDSPRATSTLITAPDVDDPRALAQRIVAEVLARHHVPARDVAEAAADVRDASPDVTPADDAPVSEAVRLARTIIADVLEERGLDDRGRPIDADGPPPLPADAIVVTAAGQDDVLLDDDRALDEALADPDTEGLTVAVGGVAVRLLEDGDHVEATVVAPRDLDARDLHDPAAGDVDDPAVSLGDHAEVADDPDDPAVIARRLVRETLDAADAARAEAETARVEVEAARVEVEPEAPVGDPTAALFADQQVDEPEPELASEPEPQPEVASEDELTRPLRIDRAGSTAALPVEDEPTAALEVDGTRTGSTPVEPSTTDAPDAPDAADEPVAGAWDEAEWHDLEATDEPAPRPVDEPVAEWRWASDGSSAVSPDEPARVETPTDGVDLATLPPPEASPAAVLRSLDAPQPRQEATEPRSRTGRWLLVTLLGAVGLALLLPLTVQALRTLITLN